MARDLVLKKNKAFPGSASLGVVAEASGSPALALALAEDTRFPSGTTQLGKVNLSGETSQDIVFGKGAGKVTFGAKAGAFASIGVFPKGASVLAALELDSNLGTVTLDDVPDTHFLVLRTGYTSGASAAGSIALGAGVAPTFDASVERNGAFAVVRRLPKSTGARTAIQSTLDSWTLPRRVTTATDLEPGSWIVAEVDGSVGVKLGATYGYDFNWVRKAQLGGLSGDIGLRIQLGVSMALGFSASGKYAVVMSRDSDDASQKRLRLRLFKLESQGWDFALNGGATVTGDTGKFLPGQFDQFIAAVFGLDPAQLMADLANLEKWTNPQTPLPDLLADIGTDGMFELLSDLTGVDAEAKFDQARSQVLGLLDKWNKLDHEVATKLWSFVGAEGGADLARVRDFAQQVAGFDTESLRTLLTARFAEVRFLATPEGQWLESAVGNRLLSLLTVQKDVQSLQVVARKTLAVLDGSKLEATLTRLHQRIGDKLGIDKIEKAADQNSFDSLDAWLKAKVSGFLGSKVDFDKLQEVRQTIDLLLEKRQSFYDKAVAALNKSYQFSFAAAYQRNTAKSALLDVVFDFGNGDFSKELKDAVDGKFDRLLVESVDGVTLNVATLTHEINRQAKVSVDLPFFKKDVTEINKSLAKVSAAEDDGRILMYDLDASDVVTEAVDAKNLRNSRLAIGGVVSSRVGELRQYSADGLTYDYSFRQATEGLRSRALEFQLEPYVGAYFPDHFSPDASFATWLANIDRTIDSVEHNGAGVFGNTLISLDVSLPSEVTAAWLKAPTSAKDEAYAQMSRNLQAALKRTLVYHQFRDAAKFKSVQVAQTLLAYAAIPPSTSVAVTASSLTFDTNKDIYWDWKSKTVRRAMLENSASSANLGRSLGDVHRRLQAEPGLKSGTIDRYDPAKEVNLKSIVEAAMQSKQFESLLFVESQMVRSALAAGLAMAEFAAKIDRKPSEAVTALAKFGSQVTQAFNKRLGGVYDRGALRPLGSQLYVAAALAFSPGLSRKGAAMAELVVLKKSVPFPPAGFPDQAPPAPDDIVIAERLVNDRLVLG